VSKLIRQEPVLLPNTVGWLSSSSVNLVVLEAVIQLTLGNGVGELGTQ